MTLEERYAHLKALAAEVAPLGSRVSGPPDDQATLIWLGRLGALIEADGSVSNLAMVKVAIEGLGTSSHDRSRTMILSVLYRALAGCELALPASARGAYIAVF